MAENKTPPAPPQSANASGMAIAALSLGIASLVLLFCCTPLTLITGVLAIIFGALEKKNIKEGRSAQAGMGFANAGLIMGIIAIVLLVLIIIVYIILVVIGVLAGDTTPSLQNQISLLLLYA